MGQHSSRHSRGCPPLRTLANLEQLRTSDPRHIRSYLVEMAAVVEAVGTAVVGEETAAPVVESAHEVAADAETFA